MTKKLRLALWLLPALGLFFLFSQLASPDREVVVVAHRGGALYAPENTLAALELAIESGATVAEIDIQQTADGTLITLHDDSYLRTAGVNRMVWELSLPEAQSLDLGGGQHIPTLEQMLSAAQGRIALMIELKACPYARNMADDAIALIQAYGMEEQCAIASMDEKLLRRAKLLEPELTTVFISSRLVEPEELDFADVVSIKYNRLSKALLERCRAAEKPLYVWTVNSRPQLLALSRLRPDGVITDDPRLAHRLLN